MRLMAKLLLLASLLATVQVGHAQSVGSETEQTPVGFEGKLRFFPYWSYRALDEQLLVFADRPDEKKHQIAIADLWPNTSARLQRALTRESGKEILPEGSFLVLMTNGDRIVGCPLARPRGWGSLPCFFDPDSDGDFDYWFFHDRDFEFMMFSFQARSSRMMPLGAVAQYSRQADWPGEKPFQFYLSLSWKPADEYPFIKRAGYSICATTNDLKTIWGGSRPRTECLRSGASLKVQDLPSEKEVFGMRIKVADENPSGAYIQVKPAEPQGTIPFF